MINSDTLADALLNYVIEHKYLELTSMDMVFMPQNFKEVADKLASIYEEIAREKANEPRTTG